MMCYFVIIAFPSSALSSARGLLRSTFHMQPTTNVSIKSHFPDDWMAFYLADEMCGCDMYTDPDRETSAVPFGDRVSAFRVKHLKPKYRKQGWTPARIERAIEEMEIRQDSHSPAAFRGLRIDVRRALAELAATAESVRAVVHWFSGEIDDEPLIVANERVTVLNFISNESLIKPDVLYEISAADNSSRGA